MMWDKKRGAGEEGEERKERRGRGEEGERKEGIPLTCDLDAGELSSCVTSSSWSTKVHHLLSSLLLFLLLALLVNLVLISLNTVCHHPPPFLSFISHLATFFSFACTYHQHRLWLYIDTICIISCSLYIAPTTPCNLLPTLPHHSDVPYDRQVIVYDRVHPCRWSSVIEMVWKE